MHSMLLGNNKMVSIIQEGFLCGNIRLHMGFLILVFGDDLNSIVPNHYSDGCCFKQSLEQLSLFKDLVIFHSNRVEFENA